MDTNRLKIPEIIVGAGFRLTHHHTVPRGYCARFARTHCAVGLFQWY
jgi:hypothetical protein